MQEWHSLTLEELEKRFNSSTAKGITVADARKRILTEKKESGGRQSLFVKDRKHPLKTLLSPFLSPFVLLLSASALFSIVLGQYTLGACVFLISLASCLVMGIIMLISQRHFDSLNDYASPMIKVIRDGKPLYTDGRNAVCGDLVCFSKGDVITADIRLISSEKLTVKELYNTKSGVRNRIVEKDFRMEYMPQTVKAPDAENMLYAGSVILKGEGMGMVVSTAKNVYLAAYLSDGALDFTRSESKEINGFSKQYRIAYVISIIALSVLLLISLLTLNENSFLSNFLLILSSFAAVSIEFTDHLYKQNACIHSSAVFKSAEATNDTSACIRGEYTLETLSDVTDVVLLGKTALSSGALHVNSVYSAGKKHDNLSPSDILGSRILGCVDSYIRAQRDSAYADEISKEGITESLLTFLRSSEFDFGAALLTTLSLYYTPDIPGKTGHACVETKKGEYRVTLTLDQDILTHCSCVRTADGMDREMYRFYAESIDAFLEENRESAKCIFVVTEYDGEAVLEAIISLSQMPSRELIPSVSELKKLNVKTVFMSLEEKSISSYDDELANTLFNGRVAYASSFRSEGKNLADSSGEYCAYFGFSADEYASLIKKMRESGACVAAYSVEDRYYEVMSAANLAISCDVINYSSDNHKMSVYEKMLPEGRESSLRCSQRTRLLSSVIVRRTHKCGGGLSAVVNSIISARESTSSFLTSVLFVTFILSLVFPVVLMSVISGISLANAVGVSVSVFFAILVAFLVLPYCKPKIKTVNSKKDSGSRIFLLIKDNLSEFVWRSSASVAACIPVVLLELLGVFGEESGYAFALHTGLLLAIGTEMLFFVKKFCHRMPKRAKISALALFLTAIAVLLITAVLAIFDGSSLGTVGTFEFFLVPIFPITYFASMFVFRIVVKARKKEKK